MGKLFWVFLLLATTCLLYCIQATPVTNSASSDAGSTEEEEGSDDPETELNRMINNVNDEHTVKESNTMETEEGENVNQTLVRDDGCHMQISRSIVFNGTNSTTSIVIDDMDDDIELILMPSSNDTCFVRRAPEVRETCQSQNADMNTTTNATTSKDYKTGATLELSDLPKSMHTLCQNRTIMELVENDDTTTTTTATAIEAASSDGRVKRSWGWGYCCRSGYVLRCYTSCYSIRRYYRCGWWGRCILSYTVCFRSCYYRLAYSCLYSWSCFG